MTPLLSCFTCSSSRAIRHYADQRYRMLAKGVIWHLQRLPAEGYFRPLYRTAWDEHCHDLQFGPDDARQLDVPFFRALEQRSRNAILQITAHEAPLLTAAALWASGGDECDWAGESDHVLMRRHLDSLIIEIAMHRDLSPFDL